MSTMRVRFRNTFDEEFELELENRSRREIFNKHQQTLLKLKLGSVLPSQQTERIPLNSKNKHPLQYHSTARKSIEQIVLARRKQEYIERPAKLQNFRMSLVTLFPTSAEDNHQGWQNPLMNSTQLVRRRPPTTQRGRSPGLSGRHISHPSSAKIPHMSYSRMLSQGYVIRSTDL